MTERQRAERILNSLADVNEDLLALLDDVWLGIDHRDRAAREVGNAFLDSLDDKITAFRSLTDDITALMRQRHGIAEDDTPGNRTGTRTTPANPELSARRAHYLGEDFTFTRPVGFTLGEQAFTGVTTWRELHITLCRYIAEQNPRQFAALPENPKFISQQNYPMYRRVPTNEHRKWVAIMPDVYVYVHLSANDTCKWISRLLEDFGIPETSMKIYLNRERDTAGDEVA